MFGFMKKDKYSVLFCAAGLLIVAKILIEQLITGYIYLGVVNSVIRGRQLFNLYMYIMAVMSLSLMLGKKNILLVASVIAYLVYMIIANVQWFNVYDFLKIEAYVLLLSMIVIDYLNIKIRDMLLLTLNIIPAILMLISVIYKIFAARIYRYLSFAVFNLLCDVIEFGVLLLIGIHYYNKFKSLYVTTYNENQ